jgi:prepilin-type N-terminal cleavage/methylation domain-containing protein
MVGNGSSEAMKSGRGFSLIEAMIALGILLVGMTGIALSFQAQTARTVAARNQGQAGIIAQSVLAELSDSNPEEWDKEELEEMYRFDYDGNRVTEDALTYYRVDLGIPVENPGWWDVTIGVTWAGWRAEQQKTGYGTTEAEFAYVLEAEVAPFIP